MVREFLEEVRRMPAEVKAAEARLVQIRADAVLLKSPRLGDKVQTSAQNGLESIVSLVEEQEKKTLEKWGKLLEMRRNAELIIELLPEATMRAVLTDYYILGYTWEKVADDLYYSRTGVVQIRNRAIDFLEMDEEARDVTKVYCQM